MNECNHKGPEKWKRKAEDYQERWQHDKNSASHHGLHGRRKGPPAKL